jgi:hypothetical protein
VGAIIKVAGRGWDRPRGGGDHQGGGDGGIDKEGGGRSSRWRAGIDQEAGEGGGEGLSAMWRIGAGGSSAKMLRWRGLSEPRAGEGEGQHEYRSSFNPVSKQSTYRQLNYSACNLDQETLDQKIFIPSCAS